MDRQLRAEIVNTVNKAVMEMNEVYNERWLTDDQLCEHIGVFTKRWLKDNGHMLPRSRAEWGDASGLHNTKWVYPLHQIQRMFQNGEIKRLSCIF